MLAQDFNVNKYQFLHISPSNESGIDGLNFNGKYISCTKVAKHLCHFIGCACSELSVCKALNTLTANTNGIFSLTGNAHTNVKYQLLKISLYGSVTEL